MTDFEAMATADQASGDVAMVLRGELDMATANHVAEVFDRSVPPASGSTLWLDCAQLTFVDSAGLRAILLLRERGLVEGWQVRVEPRSDQVERLLEITGMRELLSVPDAQR